MRHYTCIIQINLTYLRASVNNKISHVCKSKVMYHGNAMSRGNFMFVKWKFHDSSCGNYYFYDKLWNFTYEILHVAMCVHACRNKL